MIFLLYNPRKIKQQMTTNKVEKIEVIDFFDNPAAPIVYSKDNCYGKHVEPVLAEDGKLLRIFITKKIID